MTIVNITIGISSPQPRQVSPGVFSDEPIEYKNIKANVLEGIFNIGDGTSIEQDSKGVTRLSFVMANDATNRLGRLSYVTYLGTKYKVTYIRVAKPRVEVTLGGTYQNE